MVNVAFDAPVEFAPRDQIEDAERRLYELAETGRYGGGFQKFETALTTAVDMAARAYQRDGKLSGLATGLTDLDSKMGGLQASDLIIVAGRPGMGKTALATNIAYNVARAWRGEVRADGHIETVNGGIVGFFSLEMSAEQLATRIIAEQTGIPSSTIRRGGIHESDFEKIKDVAVELQHLPFFIDETGGLTVAQLAARARRLKRQKGLDLLVIDYIQLLQGSTRRALENRVQEVTEITTSLKALAKELNVPVAGAVAAVAPGGEPRRQAAAALRSAGIGLHRAGCRRRACLSFARNITSATRSRGRGAMSTPNGRWRWPTVHGKAEIIIGKQRHGPTGTVNLQFDAAVTRFDNLERDEHLPRPNLIESSITLSAPLPSSDRIPPVRVVSLDACEKARYKHGMIIHDPDLRPDRATLFAPRQSESGGVLTIDLAAVEANWKLLAGMTLPVECAAAVKANAYGCGLEAVTRTLSKAGCRTFFVADLMEARSVRVIAPDATIYVLNGMMPGSAASFRGRLLSSCHQQSHRTGGMGRFHLAKGLARRGGPARRYRHEPPRDYDRRKQLRIAPRIHSGTHGLTLLMSHLACAETPDHPLNDRQIRMFREIRILYRGLRASLANSSGYSWVTRFICDLVRPGIAHFRGQSDAWQKKSNARRSSS